MLLAVSEMSDAASSTDGKCCLYDQSDVFQDSSGIGFAL